MAEKVPGPPVIDASLEGLKRWQLERQRKQNFYNRGSRYPPFSIEPVPYGVQRTSRIMTDEERFLRKQWLNDQVLASSEPRNVPEAIPTNNFRKIIRKPWDAFERFLARNVASPSTAYTIRRCAFLGFSLYAVVLFGYYQARYTHNTWEKACGVQITGRRHILVGDEEEVKLPDFGRFNEREYQNS